MFLAVLIVAGLFLIGCGSSPKTEENSPSVKTASAGDEKLYALLEDYLDVLQRTEQNSKALLWAMSYTEAAVNSNDWEEILKARMAVSTAEMYLEATELTENQTTEDMYRAFSAENIDVSAVKSLRKSYAEDKHEMLRALTILEDKLDIGIFSKRTLDTLLAYTQYNQIYYRLSLEELAVRTDDLLVIELGESSQTDSFRRAMREACPLISAYQSEDVKTQEDTHLRGTAIIDQMRETQNTISQLETQFSLISSEQEYEFSVEDYETLDADLNIPSGLSWTLPYPTWGAENISAVYYLRDGDNNANVPTPGEDIEKPPNVCVLTFEGVAEDEVYDYMLLLMDYDVEILDDKAEEDSFMALCEYERMRFIINWEKDTASVSMNDGILGLLY